MAAIGSFFLVDGIPRNGATVKLWSSGAAFLTTPPQKNTALPLTGSYVQTTTTGTTHGGDGAYRFTGVTAGVYYVSIEWNDLIVYDSFEVPTSGTPTGVASVKAYGAVGDGVTNDTTAIQAALDDTAVSVVYFPPGTYLTGTINITSRTGLKLEGSGATLKYTGTGSTSAPIGVRIAGTCRDIAVQGFRFLGDAVAANYHCGVQIRDAATVEGLRIKECHFENLALGIWFNRTASGTWNQITIADNWFDVCVGTGTSQGRFIRVNATGVGNPRLGLSIADNAFYESTVHAIEIVEGTGISITGNQFQNHRTLTGTGTTTAALHLKDVEEVVVSSNRFYAYTDGALALVPVTALPVRNISIVGNVIANGDDDTAAVVLGSTSPASAGNIENVAFVNNLLYLDGRAAAALVLDSGVRVRIAGNQFEHLVIPSGTRSAIHLSGSGDSGGTRTYNDDIQVEGNLLYGTTSGGTFVGINLASAFCTSIARAVFRGNRNRGGLMFASGTTITNTANLEVIDQDDNGISMSAGTELGFVETGATRHEAAREVQTREITADRALDATDEVVFVNAAGGAVAVTLPTANAASGRTYTIIRTDTSTNGVTVAAQGGETIQGTNSLSLTFQYQSMQVKAIGTTTWIIDGGYNPSFNAPWRTVNTSVALTTQDVFVVVDTSGGNVTLTLPSLATSHGKVYFIFKPSASNDLVLDGNAAETIDGSATQTVQAADGALTLTLLVNNKTDWEFAYRTWT